MSYPGCALALLLSFVALPAAAQQPYVPPAGNGEWKTRSPAAAGYDPAAVADLYAYLERTHSKSFILLRDGEIVLEHYMNGHGRDSLWYWASAGKTLLAAAIGIAAGEGAIDLSAPVSDYLGTGWTAATAEQEDRITVLDQLRMTTGLDEEYDFFCTDADCLRYRSEAGTRWAYHNAPYMLLHDVLEAATGRTTTQYVLSRFRPAGITGAFLPFGEENRVFVSTTRTMARFGLLLLREGKWNGERIIPADYYAAMTTPSQPLNSGYGLLTWLNGQGTYMRNGSPDVYQGSLLPSAPADAYLAAGKNGQLLSVAPRDGLVWVRMGQEPAGAEVGDDVGADYADELWRYVARLTVTTGTGPGESANLALVVAPNPVRDILRLRAPQPLRWVELYGPDGRRLLRQSAEERSARLLVSGLRPGLYRLRAVLEDGRAVVRPVVVAE
ncbi:serine hydrolase domain-containing protein [Lewinella sp. IMCC34183]|uniref:serine hydrolase domain-containing protein n=1 Tax=Lewinella sp. IMCC34183 TaxID=2248762 RepID=UPI000E22789C|nr:serine hydrolase [Lewinella sp. IMCC34183]